MNAAMLKGGKGEDALAVTCEDGVPLLAVFDGHNSRQVAAFAAQEMFSLVRSTDTWPRRPGEALPEAVRLCHEKARAERLQGGSTALVVACSDEHVWCCNAGDSRAVAGLRGGGARRLSVDHRASTPEETARIAALGCSVTHGRVDGILEVSRGIGDFCFERCGFSCLADVACARREEVDFVVLGTDGLWDAVGDEACCELVRRWGVDGAAARLVEHAYRVRGEHDIAVVVAQLS